MFESSCFCLSSPSLGAFLINVLRMWPFVLRIFLGNRLCGYANSNVNKQIYPDIYWTRKENFPTFLMDVSSFDILSFVSTQNSRKNIYCLEFGLLYNFQSTYSLCKHKIPTSNKFSSISIIKWNLAQLLILLTMSTADVKNISIFTLPH